MKEGSLVTEANKDQNKSIDPSALKLNDLTVGYEGKIVVDHVNLEIMPGQIVSLVGPNGTGKSTVLKTISRSITAVGGTVEVVGKDTNSMSALEFAQQASVLLTDHMRTDLLTCRDIVEAGRYPYTGRMGVLRPEDKERVQWAMDLLNVSDLAERDFMQISDGQKQRVLIARAICQEPDVLILDEPTTYLDIRYQAEMVKALKTLTSQQNCAVITSLHELDLARKISDMVVCIKDKKILKAGDPEQVLDRQTIQELFDLPNEGYHFFFGDDNIELKGKKRLRCGWTTGTCAAAATRAAAQMLTTGTVPSHISLTTPSGAKAFLEVEAAESGSGWARCTVIKDAGDDPDITNGMPVISTVAFCEGDKIIIEGGQGVGRVTRPGLDQPVGNAAINTVPRQMILQQAQEALQEAESNRAIKVTISLPDGIELAKKTFNPRLGIEGGLSVLGTSGVVKPMSEEALIASIRAELSMHRAEGDSVVLMSPGNYGADFSHDHLGLEKITPVQCSNFIGQSIDAAAEMGFESILFVAHIGKLVKVAAGIMNTHSRVADGRRETIAAHAALNGADAQTIASLMECTTTDDALDILIDRNIADATLASIMKSVEEILQRRAGSMRIETIMFSKVHGILGRTNGSDELACALNAMQQSKSGKE